MKSLLFPTGVEGDELDVPYACPSDIAAYLLRTHPALFAGGILDEVEQGRHLQGFWQAYKQFHPSHPVFREHGENLSRVIPVLWRGDEGRGKRRGNTTVISLEAALGAWTDWRLKTRQPTCTGCCPPPELLQRFPPRNEVDADVKARILAQQTNMRCHSYMQHWPLFILPGVMYKEYKGLIQACLWKLEEHMRDAFYSGVEVPRRGFFFLALVGAKGDLKWYTRCVGLERSFEHQGFVRNLQIGHECEAGSDDLPWEHVAVENPCWASTVHASRP